MSGGDKTFVAFCLLLAVVFVTGGIGLAYQKHLEAQDYRACIEHYTPAECRRTP